MGTHFTRAFQHWLPLALLTTCVVVLIYVVTLRHLHDAAFEPQLQIAQDAVAALRMGQPPDLLPNRSFPSRMTLLLPFMVVFNERLEPEYVDQFYRPDSTVTLVNPYGSPSPPAFRNAAANTGQPTQFTFITDSHIPTAAVLVHFTSEEAPLDAPPHQGGYVLVARAITPTQSRQSTLRDQVILGWVVTLTLLLAAQYVIACMRPHTSSTPIVGS